MNVGSLFSGIGGFDYGLERAGMRLAWMCEADEFCQRALAYRWPGVPCYPDVRELRGDDVEPVDLLCGGFPCQDISLAGAGAGIDGARSGLWAEYARLIREIRPRYVVVENVAALLTRGLGRVLGDLATCGYDAEWDCIPASAVGAPHRRDRVWLVAYPQRDELRQQQAGLSGGDVASVVGDDGSSQPLADSERGGRPGRSQDAGRGSDLREAEERREGSGEPAGCCASGGAMAYTDGSSDSCSAGELQDADKCALQPWRVGGRAAQAGGSEWWAVEPPVGRVAHGVPDRLAQLAAYGNALVPQIPEWIGQRILEYEARRAA